MTVQENTLNLGGGKTWRRLVSIARPQFKPLAWGLLFLAISSAASLAFPQIIRWMIDNVLQPRRLELLLPLVLVLFVAFVLQSVAGSLRYYLFTLAGERIVIQLRQRLYGKILSQEVAFFDFNRTGDLMSRLASDCSTLQNTVSVNISMTLRNIGQVLGGLAFMFYTSWKLSAIMLVLIPPTAGATAIFGKKIRNLSRDFQESLAEASIIAEETISGIRTVKSFVQEDNEIRRYSGVIGSALNLAQKRIRAVAEFMTLAMVVGFAAICFVLWYGGREVVLDHLSVGDLTQFLLYLMIVAIGVGSLGGLWGDLMAGIGASLRVFDILELNTKASDAGITLERVEGQIEFKEVSFSYPTRPQFEVIKGLNFVIAPGKTVALVGSSGGGKSTIASLLSRYYEPTSGEILVDGTNSRSLNLSWLRSQIGIVSQEPVLISTTIFDNIRYGRPEASEEEVRLAAETANAAEFISRFPDGYQTRVGEKGIQLSGGQKQRVAIARALLKNPRILILDEATSNLDTASEALVQEALQRLMKSRTTLVIAHRLATVKDADQILVVDGGRIVQKGTHAELIKDEGGFYFRLLQRQFAQH